MSKSAFEVLARHVNQFEVRSDKYHIPNVLQSTASDDTVTHEIRRGIPAFQKIPDFTPPKICVWAFMSEPEIEALLECKSLTKLKKMIENKLCQNYPKAGPKIITTELLYSVFKFGRTSSFNIAQTATLLSIFYLTHRYFTVSYTATAEDTYYYFKDILSHHSLQYEPEYVKVFEPDDAQKVFHYFCKLYLRHLPIIRLCSLPSFEFELSLFTGSAPIFKKEKEGKNAKKGKK